MDDLGQELHMDGYGGLSYSGMLPLVKSFKSLRVLHLEAPLQCHTW